MGRCLASSVEVRAQHWNQETYERTATARCRRAEEFWMRGDGQKS